MIDIFYGIPDALVIGPMVAVTAAAFYAGYRYASSADAEPEEDFDDVDGLEDGYDGFEMPSYGPGEKAGAMSTYLRERKKRSALSKGYVRWHLVGSGFSSPKYVKPEREQGGNVAELEHDDETYYFPEDAMVPSEEEGVPVAVHRRGESDPVNLRDGWDLALDANTLKTYLETRVTSEKPSSGGLGIGDWDAMRIFRYGLLLIVGLFIALETLGGGIA